jgi:hypothetical protein
MTVPGAVARGWQCDITDHRGAAAVGNREHGELSVALREEQSRRRGMMGRRTRLSPSTGTLAS